MIDLWDEEKVSQPFIITFFKAVIVFKRVVKQLRERRQKKKNVKKKPRYTILEECKKSEKARVHGLLGKPASYTHFLNDAVEKSSLSLYTDVHTTIAKPVESITQIVEKRLRKYHKSLMNGQSEKAGDKLSKKLLIEEKSSGGQVAGETNLTFLLNFNTSKKDGNDTTFKVNEYVPGTPIYFGATIALQARHGGFLSFLDSSDIKASAPKILDNAQFVVKNAEFREDRYDNG